MLEVATLSQCCLYSDKYKHQQTLVNYFLAFVRASYLNEQNIEFFLYN
jgi:hypothetical protein